MAIPSLSTFVTGELVTAAKLTTQTKTAIEKSVYFKPFCHMAANVNQSVSHNAAALQAGLATVVEDTDGMADTANNRMVVQTAGLYRITAQAVYAANATGGRSVRIYVTGGTSKAESSVGTYGTLGATYVVAHATLRCTAGSTIYMGLTQTSGAALSTDIAASGMFLQAEWISL